MKPYLSYNLQDEYHSNTIWEKIVKTNFQNVEFWENEFNCFLEFLQEEVTAIINTKSSWKNTYFRFKKLVSISTYLESYLSHYEYVHHNRKDKVKNLLSNTQDSISSFYSFLWTNDSIVKKFKELKKQLISVNKKDILNSWLKNFFQDGQSPEVKKNYNKLSGKLNEHISSFLENNQGLYRNENNSIFIDFSHSHRLTGLNKFVLEEAWKNAKESNLKGWLFFMTDYTVHQIVKKSQNRYFRKRAYLKYQKINRFGEFTFKNGDVLKSILQEKHKIAQLLGKENYAQLVLSNYILNTPDKAVSYLNKVESQLMSSVYSIQAKIKELAAIDNINELQAWDIHYYFQKMNDEFNPTNKIFEEYFFFEDVFPKFISYLSSTFSVDIIIEDFQAVENKGAFFLKIKDKKSKRHGNIIFTPFNNPKKQNCYQLDFLKSNTVDDSFVVPNIQYIELQIDKSKTKKSKMSFYDMYTLVHEFGHAFHSFFEGYKDPVHKNLPMSWDLIEMPSQFLEHLVYDYDFMKSMSCQELTKTTISQQDFLTVVQYQQFFDAQHTYWNIQKYKAQLELYNNFQPYSLKNLQAIIESKMAEHGIIYNIAEDEFMTYSEHSLDYGPTGYIYLYSAQLAYQLFKKKKKNIRYIYTDIFNAKSKKNLTKHLSQFVDLNLIDMTSFLNKGLLIKTYN